MAAWSVSCVIETQPGEDLPQIVDVHLRGEALAATRAHRAGPGIPSLVIELYANLSWSLKNMEELPEWQVQ
jgi:hypothetical protein